MLANIQVEKNILENEKYVFLFSVEEVNKLVLAGVPFRDAYKKVGQDIESGNYKPSTKLNHTHEGSMGNLQTGVVVRNMGDIVSSFQFKKYQSALESLLA